ncbi:precorrin-2 dehydrogenase/sirohydrochlorin ferrochelatase family protein [Mobilicoccus pelagius]|uniref:precorrin-2 dehydrogenase n=1 Tax=Mobilicoccus pelagius NBRC 104925 TaxID=1089455 RepID=H5UR06_9MICO|nr:NAD(P)-dependent oxidoreductase [Mobilicoccus pelagius]GAB48164.1 siroheme synthase CysG [Mobilicoccus pelagius NBRC 104925]
MSPAPFLLGLSLAGRHVVAVGGGPVTARRVADLVAAGAHVHVVAPVVAPEIVALVADTSGGARVAVTSSHAASDGRISWESRPYAGEGDLDGAWLVHVATGDPEVDARVAADADRRHVFCVAAGEASRGSARVPARAVVPTESGPISLAVHAADDPRRAVAVRGAVQDHLATCAATHLASGAVDLTSRRRPAGGRDRGPVRVVSGPHPTPRGAVA